MRPFIKVSEATDGVWVVPDGDFTCMEEGVPRVIQMHNIHGLYVRCTAGKHFLDGQLEGDCYIGLYRGGE